MQDSYNQTIEFQGRVYRYDPDSDCFYPYNPVTNQTRWRALFAIAAGAVLALVIFQ